MLSKFNLLHPWNLKLTLIWSVLIGALFLAVQSGVVFLYYKFSSGAANTYSQQLANVPTNGILLSLMTICTAIICSGLILYLARRSEIGIDELLALKPVSVWQLVFWVAVLLGFAIVSNLVAMSFEQDIVTDFARDLFLNAGNMYLLFFAVVVAGPVFEELFFRGFVYHGLANSRLQAAGAIILTALIWTMVHAQYDWYVKGNIFVIGILFGLARYRSGSILPPLVMHVLMNGVSMVEVANQ